MPIPQGNFLYPYARALMLGAASPVTGTVGVTRYAGATSGIGWEEQGDRDGDAKNPFRIMFLNAGVGTNYHYGYQRSLMADGTGGYAAGGGAGVSGYAFNPVYYDSTTILRPFVEGSVSYENSGGNVSIGIANQSAASQNPSILRFGGAPVTCLFDIAPGHRTYQQTAPWSQGPGGTTPNPATASHGNYFGGTANTAWLTGCAVTYNGVADANDVVHYQVPVGAAVSAFVLYRLPTNLCNNALVAYGSTANQDRNSLLVAFFDSATGLPVNGNGGDITVVWDNGVNRIFRI